MLSVSEVLSAGLTSTCPQHLPTSRVCNLSKRQTHSEGLLNTSCETSAARSRLTLCHPRAVACRAPPSRAFPRQEYWGGLPFPPLGDAPTSGVEPASATSISERRSGWGLGNSPASSQVLLFLILRPHPGNRRRSRWVTFLLHPPGKTQLVFIIEFLPWERDVSYFNPS